ARLGQPKGADLFAAHERRKVLSLLILTAERDEVVHHGLGQCQAVGDRRGGLGDLLDDQAPGERVRAGAPVCLGGGHPEESELAKAAMKFPVKLRTLVDLARIRRDLTVREVARDVADGSLLVRRLEVHRPHALIAPAPRPAMKYFCTSRKSMIGGRVNMVAAARIWSQGVT